MPCESCCGGCFYWVGMCTVKIGSLFTGYGGLDMAVTEMFGGEVAWHCQYEPPNKDGREQRQWAAELLEYRYPGVPNLGDITEVDWSQVEPVDLVGQRGGDGTSVVGDAGPVDWGRYGPAVRQWERLTRPAPAPWQISERTGNRQLSARFAEWLMGLPDGWVTDVPGMTRNAALHIIGNGVVVQQAAYALRLLINRSEWAAVS